MIRVSAPQTKDVIDPSKPLLLYVEDEDDNWEVTELRLRGRYKLVRAADDQAACEIVRRHGSTLYAVLMDIQLKGSRLDGIQLCRLFKGQLEGDLPPYAWRCTTPAPIFFVTAYGNQYTEEELIAAGGTALITKPVDFVRLDLALARVSARSAAAALSR